MVISGNAREFEGTTVEEAVQKAVAVLRVPKEKMDVKVVCEEKKGLFGMRGTKLAKIKVVLKK